MDKKLVLWQGKPFPMRAVHHLTDHLVPHERNGYVPHVLQHHVLAAWSGIFALLKILLVVAYGTLPAASVFSSALTPDNVVHLTNAARDTAKLGELTVNPELTVAAQHKADDMAAKGYFSHTSPDGRTPWDWILDAGYLYGSAGENLAVRYTSAEGVQDGWMASPTHRQNILDPRYTEIGVAVAQGDYKGYATTFVVQMFGNRKANAVPPQPAPVPAPVPTPEPAPAPSTAPVIDTTTVAVTPKPNGYRVAAKIENAKSAEAYVGATVAPLAPQEDGTWAGDIETPPAAAPSATDHLFVGATSAEGERAAVSVAEVAPSGSMQELFVAGNRPPGTFKLFGVLEMRDLEDQVTLFYVVSIGILLAALAFKTMMRFERRHHGVMAHALVAVAFGTLMLVI